jgi:hypothetical protein
LAKLQLAIDEVFVDREASREPVDQSDQGFSMRFTGSPISKHNARIRKRAEDGWNKT